MEAERVPAILEYLAASMLALLAPMAVAIAYSGKPTLQMVAFSFLALAIIASIISGFYEAQLIERIVDVSLAYTVIFHYLTVISYSTSRSLDISILPLFIVERSGARPPILEPDIGQFVLLILIYRHRRTLASWIKRYKPGHRDKMKPGAAVV